MFFFLYLVLLPESSGPAFGLNYSVLFQCEAERPIPEFRSAEMWDFPVRPAPCFQLRPKRIGFEYRNSFREGFRIRMVSVHGLLELFEGFGHA
ncbi:hypothetical protein F4780DRAFT_755240 [Xylariomycetidae sp. FL0641]|nr:hypothetical protein F4780DRAFT_755240 [Xylariomycetidae sp. FL0641]